MPIDTGTPHRALNITKLEIWKPVVGWEGFYEVSNYGRVKSVERTVPRKDRWDRDGTQIVRERILKPSIDDHRTWTRYHRVYLCRKSRYTMKRVHTLVLEAFEGACPSGMECRHKDGDPTNNHWPENLCWDTPLKNAQDKLRHGTHVCGEKQGSAKLTAGKVRYIRQSCKPTKTLMEELEVGKATITRARQGESWKHIDVHPHYMGKGSKGEANGRAKLTDEIVREVRASPEMAIALASRFGVSTTVISNIKKRKLWKHIDTATTKFLHEKTLLHREIMSTILHNEMRETNECYSDGAPIEIIDRSTIRIIGTTYRLVGFANLI